MPGAAPRRPHAASHGTGFTSVIEVLSQRRARTPDRTAYLFLADGDEEQERLSYSGLEAKALAIAAALTHARLAAKRALLLYPPGLDFVAAFFGCLYAGAIAVPAYPPQSPRMLPRLLGILDDAQPAVALTSAAALPRVRGWLEGTSQAAPLRWLATDELQTAPAGWQPAAPRPEAAAFLQYTSGSIEIPKGVIVTHANLAANLRMIQEACSHSEASVFVSWLPLYHDLGLIGNVLQAAWVGALCVLMAPVAFLQQPGRWPRAVSRYRGSTSGAPNFAYDLCARKVARAEIARLDLSSWRIAFNGAEPVREQTLARFAAAFAPAGFHAGALYPCYGLAEATLMVSGGRPGEGPQLRELTGRRLVSCGRALQGLTVEIVDPDSGISCPPGATGEIWVAGASVAAGYWNRPQETAQTFAAHRADGRGPWLRTGDLGIFDGDELFVAGRLKELIILRGGNHYPQDLEATAETAHPALACGIAAAFTVEAGGGAATGAGPATGAAARAEVPERLVVVHEVERNAARPQEIATALRQAIAEVHEVQVNDVVLVPPRAVPRTTSGKVQRRACRDLYLRGELPILHLDRLAPLTAEIEPELPPTASPPARSCPPTWLRQAIAAAGIDPVRLDPGVPLSACGLDSLSAAALQQAVADASGVSLPLADLLHGMTLSDLEQHVAATEPLGKAGQGAEAGPAASTVPAPDPEAAAGTEDGEHPLSWNQRSLWFLHRLAPESPAYNVAGAARLAGAGAVRLGAALQTLVDRHPMLRATFAETSDGPVQSIAPCGEAAFTAVDATGWSDERIQERLQAEAFRPFDLAAGPVLRAALLQRATEAFLVLAVHHVACDFWSMAVLARELAACSAGQTLPPALPLYTDYARRQQRQLEGPAGERLLQHWRGRVAGTPAIELPTDRPRRPVQALRGGTRTAPPSGPLAVQVRRLAAGHGCTPFAVLLAAWQTLLARFSGQQDFLIGVPTAGRPQRQWQQTVGYFVNPVPLRADLTGDPTAGELLARVRLGLADALAHQQLPFAMLAEHLRPERDLSRQPLVSTMLTHQQASAPDLADFAAFALGVRGVVLDLGALSFESIPLRSPAAQMDLSLMSGELRGGLALCLQWDADLFDDATAARLLGQLDRLLGAMAEAPERRIWEIELLSAAERDQSLLFAGQASAYPRGSTIHRLFEEQVRVAPERIAVTACDGSVMSYGELNARANRLAHHLLALGAAPEIPIGVALERSPEMIVAQLGILKAGGAYVPLDPTYPPEHLALLIAELGLPFAVTEERFRRRLPAALPVVLLDREGAIAWRSDTDTGAWSHPISLAYVLFTSGSTGRPKAVGVGHRAVVRLVRGGGYVDLGPEEVLLQLAHPCFDLATLEVWGPLLNGGRLVLFPPRPPSPDTLSAVLTRDGVTTLWLTAGLFHDVVDSRIETLRPLRQLLAGGDVLSPDHLNRVIAELPGCTVIDGYGPTENTTFTCCHTLSGPVPPGASVPIGRPIANTWAYVLDRRLQLVPTGVPGELLAGGDGLARGYLRRPDLTAERFVPNPFAGSGAPPGARLYRTGDRARLRPDGVFEFLGRLDDQVKIRGFRVEPGEVEAVIASHPAVTAVAVLARDAGAAGKRLEAFVSLSAPADLRAWAKQRLPAYMVPAAFLMLPRLPLNASGKIDRRALAHLEVEDAGAAAGCRPPRTATQELLAGIWRSLLGTERLGLDDDFFARGGHSLLANRLIARLRAALGVEVPVAAVFANPTLAGLAAVVDAARRARATAADPAPPLVPQARPAHPPLSHAQERLWFLDRLEPGNPAYIVPMALRLRGPLAAAGLAAALTAVERRHESLRTLFGEEAGRPVQRICLQPRLRLAEVDLTRLPEAVRRAAAGRHTAELARRPFDLAAGPLLRAVLLRLAADESLLALSVHHLVFDGWSAGILMRELGLLYAAAANGRPAELAPLAVQYADFALWQREWLTAGLGGQLAFWRHQLAGAPAVLDLPADRPRPSQQSFRGAAEPAWLPPELVRGLRALASRQEATLFMTLLAGWASLLGRSSSAAEVVVGTPLANRPLPVLEELIGLFVNTLPLRIGLADDPPFTTLLARVRAVAIAAYDHQDVPFERLVEAVGVERDLARSPLFQVMLALEDGPARALQLPGVTAEELPVHNGAARLELLLALAGSRTGAGEALEGGLEFNTDLFDVATARRLLGQLTRLLAAAAAEPARPIGDLPLLAAAEEQQLLTEWNATAAAFPDHLGLHELFTAQAARTPAATALIHGARRLSYRELDAWSDRLARRLDSLGVGPEARVGILCGRRPVLVAAALAVLKAGGAYVPLDPSYPAERLALLLADAAVSVVLVDGELAAAAPPLPGTLVLLAPDAGGSDGAFETDGAGGVDAADALGGPAAAGASGSRAPLRGWVHPDQSAYVIYTSGSTGAPKGVVIRHRSAVARISWALAAYPREALAGVLAATSLCFDLSVFEIFAPLAAGGAAVLADDLLQLPSLPAVAAVTLVNTVPSALDELVRVAALPPSVRVVNLAGEPLHRELAARLYACAGVEAVYNLYGPSEDTTYSTAARVERRDERQPAIGLPLSNTRAHVLDAGLRPAPPGAPGELCLAGAGLARGYLERPDATADRFRPDPFSPDLGGRLYRTGDLARRRQDGCLEFLGRLDHQIKVRGFRIEPGEIEAALTAHPAVREAAVLALAGAESRSLVACVAPAELEASELRRHLAGRLPSFMLPAAFLALPALPRTVTGKIDRRALARLAPGAARAGRAAYVAPRNAVEELLSPLWAEVLELDRVGAHDDFFLLGGHSLAGVRLVARVHELFGVRLAVRELFRSPTLAGMAEVLTVEMAMAAGDELLDEIAAEVSHG